MNRPPSNLTSLGIVSQTGSTGASCLPIIYPLAVLLAGLLWGGCGKNSSSNPPPDSRPASAQTTPLEACLALWAGGSQEEAVDKFLQLEWDSARLFSSASPLHYSEAEFAALPAANGERALKQAQTQLGHLKALAQRVSELARQAQAQADQAKEAQCSNCLYRCGQVLDQPQSLMLARKVGIALRTMATQINAANTTR